MRILPLLLSMLALTIFAQVRVTQVDAFSGKPGSSIGAYVHHKNPGNLTAYVQNSLYLSTDSGKTWTQSKLPDLPSGVERQVTIDQQGTAYYYYVATSDNGNRIEFCKSKDDGKEWSSPAVIPGSKGRNRFVNMSTHPRKDGVIFVWTQSEEVEDTKCATRVIAMISASGGKKWEDPTVINKEPGDCSGKATMVNPAAPMVARDGKVFVVWAANEKLYIDRSYDGGEMWITTDLPIGDQPGGWSLVVPGVPGLNSAPATAIDNSDFRTVGTLYIAYADQKNGATDTDIWMIRSPNLGDNWTYPLRVNLDEPGKYQYSPRMVVDHGTGFLYIVYFDRRNYDDAQADVYLAWSGDAGVKFQEIKVNTSPISAEGASGALLNVAAHKGIVTVMWAVAEGDQTVVRAGIIRQVDLE